MKQDDTSTNGCNNTPDQIGFFHILGISRLQSDSVAYGMYDYQHEHNSGNMAMIRHKGVIVPTSYPLQEIVPPSKRKTNGIITVATIPVLSATYLI